MNTSPILRKTIAIGLLAGLGGITTAAAQAPAPVAPPPVPPPVTTVWQKLGISQALHGFSNNHVNARGNHPEKEPRPGLKPLADPANLQPGMPKALQAAAQIKQAEDLAPQKIKAVKYLAKIGCGCYQKTIDVRGAMLEALDDCTETVRYATAMALCEAAGDPCNRCAGSCCSAAIMNKLQEMAQGRDDSGCPKEPSARVRAMAQGALNACLRKFPAGPVAPEPPKIEEHPGALPLKPGERPTVVPESPGRLPVVPPPPTSPVPEKAPATIGNPPATETSADDQTLHALGALVCCRPARAGSGVTVAVATQPEGEPAGEARTVSDWSP